MGLLKSKLTRLSDFQAQTTANEDQVKHIATDLIDCKPQIRSSVNPGLTDESLRELGESILSQGQLQPVLLRRHPESPERYLMIAGERRLRAAQLLSVPTILARIFDVDEAAASRLQRAENTHREALTHIEEAQAVTADYQRLGSIEAVGAEWGKSQSWVSQTMAFIKAIDAPSVREAVQSGLTSDRSVITKLARLEAIDAKAAHQVLEVLRTSPDANAREVLDEVTKKSKPASKKAKGEKQHARPGRIDSRQADALLARIFAVQFADEEPASPALQAQLSAREQKIVEAALGQAYEEGRAIARKAFAEEILRRMAASDFSDDDPRLYRSIAFLEGAIGAKPVRLRDVLLKANAVRTAPLR